jgi:3-oxoacyl-[acyl-carrier protein] reductase
MRTCALVTGGTRGIGRAICLELAKDHDIAFTYRSNAEMAKSLEDELKALGAKSKGYQVDMADAAALSKALEQVIAENPNITALVNNAGISIDGLMMRFKLEDYDALMNTNVRGAFISTQAVLRPMMKAKGGSIIFVSSASGEMGIAGQTAYSSTKAALFGMTKSLAKEVGSRGIRVNSVTPGFIQTDMTESLPAQYKDSILTQIPLGKFGEAKDIAQAVAFLASPASKYITGQILAVNGGLYM